MATKVKKTIGHKGGLENLLSGLATLFLVIGIVGAITVLLLSVDFNGRFSLLGLILGLIPVIGILVHGLFLYALCSAGAEVLRLLKKQNGLPYGGNISGSDPIYEKFCSECGVRVGERDDCPSCKATFTY
ncbi:hypothetical protein [Kangiella sp.]|uniref:hypothetical protein n=1 Tax=Kangiella sp. TaxID=1920245 RepID=UPI0019C97503|nr:hypothetical protein [Kangiella sp.]MBD3652352.1 hypothetical protein [Kangiella sp.]